MILLLDIGNTAIKWATCAEGELQATGCFVHREADLASMAEQAWGGLQVPGRVVAANVAGRPVAAALDAWMRECWSLEPEYIAATAEGHGVVNAYPEPSRLGADRWAALVGARRHAALPVCVIDCGSAITLDLLAADGRHEGGLIFPGIAMLRQALLEGTADVDAGLPGMPPGVLADDTGAAVEAGACYMAAATLERVLGDIDAGSGGSPGVLLTGGDAPRLLSSLGRTVQHDPDLVLRGLAVMATDTGTRE